MKILLVARWPVGGIRTYIRYIYSNPIFANYELTLIAPNLDITDFLENYLPKNRITLIQTENNNKSLVRQVKRVLKEQRFDLIHSHGFSAGALTCIATMANKKCPHLMTAHDVYRDEQFKGVKGRLKLIGLNLIYSRLDSVLTVGEDCFNNFKEYINLVSAKRIFNIDHGVDVEKFAAAARIDFRKELSLPENRKIIGFFGRFMSQKGFSDVIGAIKILAESKSDSEMPLVLTFGWGGFIREEYQRIEELGLQDYFKQMPFTDDMPSAIKGVDMVVMPSRWEACGLLAMEVLSAGVPLIGTNCIGLRCVLDGTPAKVVPTYNPQALANAIDAQLSESAAAFKAYQAKAIERFNLERPAKELHEFYQGIGH